MVSIEEWAAKGYNKATAKDTNIRKSWEAAKTRMVSGYDATPFGPTRKANYRAAVQAATFRTDWDKWRRNWSAKMAE
ncbi:MAG: hypothetical protein QW304_07610 [Thermoproteota archaeon]